MRPSCEKFCPSILIADDHVVFLEALRFLLEKTYPVIGTARDGRTLISESLRLRPDMIIADIRMPLLNGFDAACRVRAQLPNVRVIFLTMIEDPNLAAAVLELGPVGFVLKQSASQELLTAISHVGQGKSYVSPKVRSADWIERQTRFSQLSKELTPRQRDFLQLFSEGHPLKEIADQLNLSKKTIEFHKHQIMTAFNLKSNADLVLFAVKKGLISIEPEVPHAYHSELVK